VELMVVSTPPWLSLSWLISLLLSHCFIRLNVSGHQLNAQQAMEKMKKNPLSCLTKSEDS
jgi:hypothetical protein